MAARSEVWATAADERALAAILGLPWHTSMQDWALQVADPGRVGEFIRLYRNGGLSDGQLVALCDLILASLDDALNAGFGAALCPEVEEVLLDAPELHGRSILYWCCGTETDPDNHFALTPFMRSIWERVAAQLPDEPPTA